jgi:hypothetical protein
MLDYKSSNIIAWSYLYGAPLKMTDMNNPFESGKISGHQNPCSADPEKSSASSPGHRHHNRSVPAGRIRPLLSSAGWMDRFT